MIRVDLLRPEKKEFREPSAPLVEEYKPKKKASIPIIIILVTAIIAVYLSYNQRKETELEQGLLETAQREKKELQDVIAKLDQLEKQKLLFEKKINIIRQSQLYQEISVKIMDELSKNIPEWVWLTEVTYRNQLVRIKGKALSNELIADYIYNLETCPSLFNVKLIGSTQRNIRNNQIQEFSLTARYLLQSLSDISLSDISLEGTGEKEKK